MQLKSRQEVTQFLEKSKIIATIRAREAQSLTEAATALREGGIKCVEVTMTTPGALNTLEEVSNKVEGVLLGAGTVLDPETARLCILSGARFLVTPSLNFSVIEMAHRYDIPIIPGALTPTEILAAWERGADMVKVFPAGSLGPAYIKDLKGPFPQIKLCPTGGVNLDNLSSFLKAGASCVGVGGALVKNEFLQEKKWEELKELAKQFQKVAQNS